MTKPLLPGLGEAVRLTRAGRLSDATALIQSLLGRTDAPEPALGAGDVIEGTATPVPPPAAASAAAPSTTADRRAADPAPPAGRRPGFSPRDVLGQVSVTLRGKNTERPGGADLIAPHRAPLGETLRRIAAGGMPATAPRPVAPLAPEVPGAQFLHLSHSSAAGQRAYRLYIPAGGGADLPLVVMLHGCTQSPEDFARGTRMNALAEEFRVIVAYPEQPQQANAQRCWNWFSPADQSPDTGEPALIAGIVRDILREHGADPARVYAAGLSAGGATAALLASTHPDLFAAVAVHSGLAAGAAQDIPSAFAAMRQGATGRTLAKPVPTLTFHGAADATVHPRNGQLVDEQARRAFGPLRSEVEQGSSTRGRGYRRTRQIDDRGRVLCEFWEIDGLGHAWSGGNPAGSFTDPTGPDASRAILTFFARHSRV